MKVCWFKAMNGRKPRKGECLPQMIRGGCETCDYYREDEHTENEKAAKKEAGDDE